jgi:hypothetical protein
MRSVYVFDAPAPGEVAAQLILEKHELDGLKRVDPDLYRQGQDCA